VRNVLVILILITGMLVSAMQFWSVTVNDLIEVATSAIGTSANANVNEKLAHADVTASPGGETPVGAVPHTLPATDAGMVSTIAHDYDSQVNADPENVDTLTIAANDIDSDTVASLAQAPLWQIAKPDPNKGQKDTHRKAYFSSDTPALRNLLQNAPQEYSGDNSYIISLPLPDGSLSRFSIIESPVMAEGLAQKYPEIKSYKVFGIDDPAASGRVDITPRGFHAMLHTSNGRVTIDPEASLYRAQWRKGGGENSTFQCKTGALKLGEPSQPSETMSPTGGPIANRGSSSFLMYRLALSATVEYVTAVGGTLSLAQAEIVTAINRVNEIYERDLGIKLQLVADNDTLIELDGSPNLLTNNDPIALLSENQAWVDSILDPADYDIGHIFSTNNGGVAWVGSTCTNSIKARGVTGLPSPTGEAFYIDFVAHEIGHQFGAEHTFNGTTSSCSGSNRVAASAVEPGSGSTIMTYAGICGAENIQPNSDATFHSESIAQIHSFTSTGGGT